ncbi:FAD-binding protein [Candidatus Berkelbacteria bacterium]|nr:FAD-binding protein [Candidatus Berkelbacteria bacterium]
MSTKSSKNLTTSNQLFLYEAAHKGLQIHSHVSISEYSPSKLGAVAEFVSIAYDLSQLVELVKLAISHKINYWVVGSMYATLPSDGGIKGLVIVNKTSNLFFVNNSSQVVADSGVNLQHFVTTAAGRGLGGCEYLVTVPGTVGGAIATGVYFNDKYIWQIVKEINLLVNEDGKSEIKTFKADEFRVGKGELLFNNALNSPVILSAKLQLTSLTIREVLTRIKNYRQIRQVEKINRSYAYVFNNSIKELIDNNIKKEIFTNRLISQNKKDSDIIEFKQGVTSTDLRNLFIQIENLSKDTLRQRVGYLGYWQNNGEEI